MEFYREYNDLIMHCLDDGMRKFGIVPLGEKGMLVQYLLEHRYGIRDIVLVDNQLCRYNPSVKSVARLTEEDITGRCYIVSSQIPEITEAMKKIIPEKYLYGIEENSSFSYGPVSRPSREVASVGRFCSTAPGSCVVPNHPMNYVSTHEFMYSSYHFPQIQIVNRGVEWEDFNPEKCRIGNDVWIGRNVIILSGVSIGNGAVIGAGSVVTKDIPDYAVAVGNPARVIRYRFTREQIDQLNEIRWWDWPLQKIEACFQDFKDIDVFLEKHYRRDTCQK